MSDLDVRDNVTVAGMYKAQDVSNKAQAVPVFGLFVSVVKLPTSCIQLIIGLAVGIFFTFVAFSAGLANQKLRDMSARFALIGFAHAGMGFLGVVYSVINLGTFGIFGITTEYIKPMIDSYKPVEQLPVEYDPI